MKMSNLKITGLDIYDDLHFPAAMETPQRVNL